jgi:hypothetical protein
MRDPPTTHGRAITSFYVARRQCVNCVRLRAHISCVSTDGNKIPLVILLWISGMQFTGDHFTDLLYRIKLRANCAFSLTKHCAVDICDRSEHYIAGDWPASLPSCFTLRGKSSYTRAWVGPTNSVDVLAKRNVTAPAGCGTRFCGLPSRSQVTIHTELSRLCIVWIVREFAI